MIYNMNVGANGVLKVPVLNKNYPQNVYKTIIGSETTSAEFVVNIETAGNPETYTYQWYIDGVAIKGANNFNYIMNNISSSMNSTIYCIVTNDAGEVMSRNAVLNIVHHYVPVLDSNYPQDMTVSVINNAPYSATFEAVIETDGNPTDYAYQWYLNDSVVDGETNSTYTISGTASSTVTHNIYCAVTNAVGTVMTRIAQLIIWNGIVFSDSNTYDIVTGGFSNNGLSIGSSINGSIAAETGAKVSKTAETRNFLTIPLEAKKIQVKMLHGARGSTYNYHISFVCVYAVFENNEIINLCDILYEQTVQGDYYDWSSGIVTKTNDILERMKTEKFKIRCEIWQCNAGNSYSVIYDIRFI